MRLFVQLISMPWIRNAVFFLTAQLPEGARERIKKALLLHILDIERDSTAARRLEKELAGGGGHGELALLAGRLQALPRVVPSGDFRRGMGMKLMRRETAVQTVLLRGLATAMVMALFVGSIFSIAFFAQSDETQAAVGMVRVETGSIQVRTEGEDFFAEVSGVYAVKNGDSLKVPEGASAVLTLPDAGTVTLNSNTEVKVGGHEKKQVGEGASVRVAVVSGSIAARSESAERGLNIATPQGTVSAAVGEVEVSVNEASGELAVTTDTQAVILAEGQAESVTVPAGHAAVITDESVTVRETVAEEASEYVMPALSEVALDIDILTIRAFDALQLAVQGNAAALSRAVQSVRGDLDGVLLKLAMPRTEEERETAARIAIQAAYPDTPEREEVLRDLDMLRAVRGVVARYQPYLASGAPRTIPAAYPAGMQRVALAIHALELGSPEAEVLLDEVVRGAAEDMKTGGQFNAGKVRAFLALMQGEERYLGALHGLREAVDGTVRYLVDREIATVELAKTARLRAEAKARKEAAEAAERATLLPAAPTDVLESVVEGAVADEE